MLTISWTPKGAPKVRVEFFQFRVVPVTTAPAVPSAETGVEDPGEAQA